MVKNQQSSTAVGRNETIRILIMDDNEILCRMISELVGRMGMQADYETCIENGLKTSGRCPYDIVLLDVNLPDGCGLDIIPELRKGYDPPEIIIITGQGDEDGAEVAIKNHVWDYITKDATLQNLKLSLNRAVQYRQQKKSLSRVPPHNRDAIIGISPAIEACIEQASTASNCDSPVLLLGETGTGKEVFAKNIHENSRRSSGDFVVVDCSALPENLVESTLFGHKKGAYTSADSDRIGLVEQAHAGTLFLDEIGELPVQTQKKFLRILQEKRFRPLGGKKEIKSDFRLICATNRDLSEMVKEGRFRQDLYYRIRAMVIELPPLKDRCDDIPELVAHFSNRYCKYTGAVPIEPTADFMETLQAYDWPGNVRELMNIIESIHVAVAGASKVFSGHLPVHIRAKVARNRVRATAAMSSHDGKTAAEKRGAPLVPLKKMLENTRCNYMHSLMAHTRGNVPQACRISGLSRGHLYDLIKKYNIPMVKNRDHGPRHTKI